MQIAILRALVDEAALPALEVHANLGFLDLLREAGLERAYSSTLPATVGEWFFARHGDDDGSPDPLDRLALFAAEHGATVDDLRRFRDDVIADFIDDVVDAHDWSDVAVVAFTLTFPQVNASIWLAEELKARHPHVRVVVGGAMSQIHHASAAELMRVFPCIDFTVVGEAEPVFAPLCRAIVDARGEHVAVDLAGVVKRDAAGAVVETTTLAIAEDMGAVPFPNYQGFFAALAQFPSETRALVQNDILIELSRGCAWAVKNVCTFCGFYPDGGFRVKPNARVKEELHAQREHTGSSAFYVVDAYITRNMISNLFSTLPREVPGVTFPFVELKSDITKAHVEILAKAGVTLVQPGIEALSERLLEHIHKGVTLVDNLLLLKWCREQSLLVSYNLLLGIPAASADDEQRQLDVVRRIAHLAPPSLVPLFVVRASSYEKDPARFGLKGVRADPFYRRIFPPGADIEKLAYELVVDEGSPQHGEIHDALRHAVETWRAFWSPPFRRPSLTVDFVDDQAHLEDARDPREPPALVTLDGDTARVLAHVMDAARSVDDIAKDLSLDAARVRAIADAFLSAAVAIESDGKLLALPTRKRPTAPRALIGDLRRRRALPLVDGAAPHG